eukprot:1742961-Amphidinium_carterae.2
MKPNVAGGSGFGAVTESLSKCTCQCSVFGGQARLHKTFGLSGLCEYLGLQSYLRNKLYNKK